MALIKMYRDQVRHVSDLQAIDDDVSKLLINMIVEGDVYKVLISLLRVDWFSKDQDIRQKYDMLQGVKTLDFGIDPYLSLNDPLLLAREICLKFNLP